MSVEVDLRETNRMLARLAAAAMKLDVRAIRVQRKADEAKAEAVDAWSVWHKAWELARPGMTEPVADGEVAP